MTNSGGLMEEFLSFVNWEKKEIRLCIYQCLFWGESSQKTRLREIIVSIDMHHEAAYTYLCTANTSFKK